MTPGRGDSSTLGDTEVGRVKNFKFLGTHLSEDFSWSRNTCKLLNKGQQRLYFLRRLRKFGMSAKILRNFYRGASLPTASQCGTAAALCRTGRLCNS